MSLARKGFGHREGILESSEHFVVSCPDQGRSSDTDPKERPNRPSLGGAVTKQDGGVPGPKGHDIPETDLSNDDFSRLLNDALHGGDSTATAALCGYFEMKFRKKLGSLPYGERDDASQELFATAWTASLRAAEKQVSLPRNYVMAAVGNRFTSLLRHRYRHQRFEILSVSELANVIAESPDAIQASPDDRMTNVLTQMKADAATAAARKVVRVLEVAFYLELPLAGACEVLDFGPVESETVMRNIRRWRARCGDAFMTSLKAEED